MFFLLRKAIQEVAIYEKDKQEVVFGHTKQSMYYCKIN